MATLCLLIITGLVGLSALGVAIYVLTNIFFIALVTGVPPVQTEKKFFASILATLPITPQTVICDLGCGGGSFLLAASRLNPKACIGYELSLWPYLAAKFRAILLGRGKIQIFFRDLFKADLAAVNFVYVYLLPSLAEKLAAKLSRELSPGAIAAVKGQPLPRRQYYHKIILDAAKGQNVYSYRF